MIKTLSKIRKIEENFLNLVEGMYNRLSANILLNDKRLNSFLLWLGRKQGCPLLSLHSYHRTGNVSQWHKAGKEIKGLQLSKEEILFPYRDMVFCIEYQGTYKEVLDLMVSLTSSQDMRPIYRKQLYFYVLAMNNANQKLENNTVYSNIKNEILRSNTCL